MPILLGITPPAAPPPTPTTITSRITDNVDSGGYAAWANYWGAPDGDSVYWNDKAGRGVAGNLRFSGLAIPKGATITNAFIRLWSHNNAGASGASNYNDVGAEQVDNAGVITNATNFSTRYTNVGTTVRWAAETYVRLDPYTSPDLSSVVQEIVNRAGWSSGNAIMFFTRSDTAGGAWSDDPAMMSVNYAPSSANYPYLEVTYV